MNITIVQKWPVWLNDLIVEKHDIVRSKKKRVIENDDTIIPEPNMRCLPHRFDTNMDIALKAESIKCIHNTLNEIEDSTDVIYFLNGICADGSVSKVDFIYFSNDHAEHMEKINDRKTAILLYENISTERYPKNVEESSKIDKVSNIESSKIESRKVEESSVAEESPIVNETQTIKEIEKTNTKSLNGNELIDLPSDYSENIEQEVHENHENILAEKILKRRKSIEPDDGIDNSFYEKNQNKVIPVGILKKNEQEKYENIAEEPSWLTEASTHVHNENTFEDEPKEYKTVIKCNGDNVLELQGIIPPTLLSHLASQRVTIPLTTNAVVMISGNKKLPKVSKWHVDPGTYERHTHCYTAVDTKNVSQSSRKVYNTRSVSNYRRTTTINSLKKLHRPKR